LAFGGARLPTDAAHRLGVKNAGLMSLPMMEMMRSAIMDPEYSIIPGVVLILGPRLTLKIFHRWWKTPAGSLPGRVLI
jgi:hypothetical protein